MEEKIFNITENPDIRLDRFLALQGIASRSQIGKWIDSGCVVVNRSPAKGSRKLKAGDLIRVAVPAVHDAELLPENIPLDILFEDDDLLVINKPANMVTHPGAGHRHGTLTNALMAHCGNLSTIGGVKRPGIVHRLDKGTSGVMVIAKNDLTHEDLSEQFQEHKVKKIYHALVYGRMKNKKGAFDTLISRSPVNRKKFAVNAKKGKRAVTHYRVLKEGEGVTLLELEPETGRTHQIRVHLTSAGHSIMGDPLYGSHSRCVKTTADAVAMNFLNSLDHQLLHSKTIVFNHPVKNRIMKWSSPLPPDFEKAVTLCFGR